MLPAGTEQSSWFEMKTIPRYGVGAQEPRVRGRRRLAVGAQRAIERRQRLPETAAAVAELGDALEHLREPGSRGIVRAC